MNPIATIKRAPKWAVIGVAGLGAGAIAIKLYNGRGVEDDGEVVDGEIVDGAQQVGTAPGAGAGVGGYPGIVVPPVIIGGQGGDEGYSGALGLIGDVLGPTIDSWAGIVQQMTGGLTDITMNANDNLGALATAGGSPGSAVNNPSPIVVQVPQPAPAPVPVGGGIATAPKQKTVTKTTHPSYNKNGDCWTLTRTHYSDGSHKDTSAHRVHKGKCHG